MRKILFSDFPQSPTKICGKHLNQNAMNHSHIISLYMQVSLQGFLLLCWRRTAGKLFHYRKLVQVTSVKFSLCIIPNKMACTYVSFCNNKSSFFIPGLHPSWVLNAGVVTVPGKIHSNHVKVNLKTKIKTWNEEDNFKGNHFLKRRTTEFFVMKTLQKNWYNWKNPVKTVLKSHFIKNYYLEFLTVPN